MLPVFSVLFCGFFAFFFATGIPIEVTYDEDLHISVPARPFTGDGIQLNANRGLALHFPGLIPKWGSILSLNIVTVDEGS